MGWHCKSNLVPLSIYNPAVQEQKQAVNLIYQIGSYIAMGVSKLPVDVKPERWQLLFYVVRLQSLSFQVEGWTNTSR